MKNEENCLICRFIPFWISNKPQDDGLPNTLRGVLLAMHDQTDHKCLMEILIMKANEMHYFSNLFDKVLYIFRTDPLSIIRSISTLYTRNRYLS